MSYVIHENLILRNGIPVASVMPDGTLHIEDPELEKYRLPAFNKLRDAGRVDDVGRCLYLPPGNPEPSGETEPPPRRTIETVRELCRVMSSMTGEETPPFSRIYGDQTDAVWQWLNRHGAEYREIARTYEIKIQNNRMKGI